MHINDALICWFTDGLKRICKEEGVMSLWSGTGPSLVLAGNPAIQFMVYEGIKKFLMTEDNKVCAHTTSSLHFSISFLFFFFFNYVYHIFFYWGLWIKDRDIVYSLVSKKGNKLREQGGMLSGRWIFLVLGR